MLSSQAMCFNVFAPLSTRLVLASEILREFVPRLAEVTSIHIEYTPSADIFNDQSALGGVDCDLLIEGKNTAGEGLVLVVETKFVELEFSVCGFKKSGRRAKGRDVCPDDVAVGENRSACLYVRNKGYEYWRRSDEHAVIADGALLPSGCPFAGSRWQLWVNLVLAHVEAERRRSTDVRFAVCTSSKNTALLGGGEVLGGFRSLLRRPESVLLLDLDRLIERVEALVPAELAAWAELLSARYGGI